MKDRLSAAVLVASGATMLVVMVTPLLRGPTPAAADGARPAAETILLSASAEQRAALKERADLQALDRRVEPLRERIGRAASDPEQATRKPDDTDVIRGEVERELSRRWREFRKRLREIRR